MQYLTFIDYQTVLRMADDITDKAPTEPILLTPYNAKHELMLTASAIKACGQVTADLFYYRYSLKLTNKQIAQRQANIVQYFTDSYLRFADEYAKRGRNLIIE